MNRTHLLCAATLAISTSATSTPVLAQERAQDRRFLFSISTVPADGPRVSVHLDTLVGESAFDVTDVDHPEQRFGVQAAFGHRLTFVGRVGLSMNDEDMRFSRGSTQQGELLYSVIESRPSEASVAVGAGMRHESAGVNVLTGRIAAGRSFSAWRLDGNALFEKPFSVGRDAVDVITTLGVSRALTRAFHAGLELIGEDLEGFWEVDETEGGARLLVGPSLRIAPPSRHWQIGAAGGPLIHATRTGRTSDASRGLPSSSGNIGYAARLGFSYEF